MQIRVSPSMRSITISSSGNNNNNSTNNNSNGGSGNGILDSMKVKVASRRISYRTLLHTILLLAMLMPFVFILTAVITLEAVNNDCTSLYCLGRRYGPSFLGGAEHHSTRLVRDLYKMLGQVDSQEIPHGLKPPETYSDFLSHQQYDARIFAIRLKAMMQSLESELNNSRFAEQSNKQFAAISIPKHLLCLSLLLTDAYSSNALARRHLPPPELHSMLSEKSSYHFILATDNILAASVVVSSTVQSFSKPHRIVFHVITDKKTYAAMHCWFALNSISPAIIEVKALHQFHWLTRANLPEVLQPPNYISILKHLRIYLPELFPNLDKVVFLDDDVVVQRDLWPLWRIDLMGKVNGAVEMCRGEGHHLVMPRRFKTYLNFSHPLIARNLNPEECAWAYGMNIFDLRSWRKTSIRDTYHYWLKENLKSNLTIWKHGTLAPTLIAFNGHVHAIDQTWHMLGLGHEEKTELESVRKAAVIHYNGQCKPWLDIGFKHLRPFWTKHIDYSNDFIRSCRIQTNWVW